MPNLDLDDQEAAFAKLESWTGVEPMLSRLQYRSAAPSVVARSAEREMRMPPALVRALAARK